MKVATVKYTGPMQSKTTRGPSGEEYSFSNPMGGSPIPKDVTSLEDARKFEQSDSYDVEWTSQGELTKRTAGPVTDAKDILEDMAYQQKRSLVSKFDLDPESRKSEDIDAALKEEIDHLEKQMNANE